MGAVERIDPHIELGHSAAIEIGELAGEQLPGLRLAVGRHGILQIEDQGVGFRLQPSGDLPLIVRGDKEEGAQHHTDRRSISAARRHRATSWSFWLKA